MCSTSASSLPGVRPSCGYTRPESTSLSRSKKEWKTNTTSPVPSRGRSSRSASRSAPAQARLTAVTTGRLRWLASGNEERQLWLALAAEHREVDLDAGQSARLGEHHRLGCDLLCGEH